MLSLSKVVCWFKKSDTVSWNCTTALSSFPDLAVLLQRYISLVCPLFSNPMLWNMAKMMTPPYNPFSGWSLCHSAMTERPRPATGSSGCSQNINTLLQAELQWQEITMRVPLAIAGQTSKLLFHISQGAFTKLHKTRCNVSACARPRAYQCGAVWTWTLWVGARVESRAAGCQRVTNAGFPRSGRERDACRNRPPAVSFYGFHQERSRAVW